MSKGKKLVKKLQAKQKQSTAKKLARRSRAKKPYNAAGYSKVGAMRFIDGEEIKRYGRPGYPWSKTLKNKMVKALDGKRSTQEMVTEIDRIAGAV